MSAAIPGSQVLRCALLGNARPCDWSHLITSRNHHVRSSSKAGPQHLCKAVLVGWPFGHLPGMHSPRDSPLARPDPSLCSLSKVSSLLTPSPQFWYRSTHMTVCTGTHCLSSLCNRDGIFLNYGKKKLQEIIMLIKAGWFLT